MGRKMRAAAAAVLFVTLCGSAVLGAPEDYVEGGGLFGVVELSEADGAPAVASAGRPSYMGGQRAKRGALLCAMHVHRFRCCCSLASTGGDPCKEGPRAF